jgi:hypothetical protein
MTTGNQNPSGCLLSCLTFFCLRILVTHCHVWSSSVYGFWLPVVMFDLLLFTDSGYPLSCLTFFGLRILVTRCHVWPSSVYGFWLPVVMSDLLRFTDSGYPLSCLTFFGLRILVTRCRSDMTTGNQNPYTEEGQTWQRVTRIRKPKKLKHDNE